MSVLVHTRDREHSEPRPWRTLLWIVIAGLIFGVFQIGSIPDDLLRTARNSLHMHKASSDLVVIKIDDDSLRAVGRWPWPRRYHAQLIDELTKAGAKRIFFDVLFHEESDPVDDRILGQSLARSGRVILAARGTTDTKYVNGTAELPPPIFSSHARVRSCASGSSTTFRKAGNVQTRVFPWLLWPRCVRCSSGQ